MDNSNNGSEETNNQTINGNTEETTTNINVDATPQYNANNNFNSNGEAVVLMDENGKPVKNHYVLKLVFSILEIFLAGLFGIISLVLTILANKDYKAGKVQEFKTKTLISTILLIVGLIVGIISTVFVAKTVTTILQNNNAEYAASDVTSKTDAKDDDSKKETAKDSKKEADTDSTTAKTEITADEFTTTMQAQGYTVEDQTSKYSGDGINTYLMATNTASSVAVVYIACSDDVTAKGGYDALVSEYKGQTNKEEDNYDQAVATDESLCYIFSRLGKTVVFSASTDTTAATSAINALNY